MPPPRRITFAWIAYKLIRAFNEVFGLISLKRAHRLQSAARRLLFGICIPGSVRTGKV
jgi:hypothetical protein